MALVLRPVPREQRLKTLIRPAVRPAKPATPSV
jgi:hypothetical protein